MTVKDLLKQIIDTAESLDQEVILYTNKIDEIFHDEYAEEQETLDISINGDCLQLFMRD